MPERGQNSVQGRCPTCSQLVTLTIGERTELVECPSCRHRGMGSAFGDRETALPVIVVAVEAKAPTRVAAARAPSPAPDEQRTHLILGKGPVPRAAEEERTHLLLDATDLKDEPGTQLSIAEKMSSVTPAALRFGSWVDDLMRDRWQLTLAVFAAVFGILAPCLDYWREDPDSTATELGSWALLLGMVVFAIAWSSKLRDEEGRFDLTLARVRFKASLRLLLEDIEESDHSPRHLKLLLVGQFLALLALAGLIGAAALSLVRQLFDWPDPPSVFRLLSAVVLLGAALLMRGASRSGRVAPAPEDLGESVQAAMKLPAIVDLAEPLAPSLIGENTLFHRILVALSQWGERTWPDEPGYHAALERHFQRHLPGSKIERGKWLGRSRRDGLADIVIDDLVLLEVQLGFWKASAERAAARMNDHARTWPGKPMILTVFEAPREAVFESSVTPALVELHRRYPTLTARMPSRKR
jgi:DNA-directed RNA polymerase subunit RPC12/RpoP